MKIPKHIQDSIIKSARYNAIAKEHNEKVRRWLDDKNLGNNDTIIDYLIDSIEMGCDPNGLIIFLEKENWK